MSDPPPQVTVSRISQPVHITLSRSAKGGYYWEISIHAEDVEETMHDIAKANSQLAALYSDNIMPEGHES